MTLISSLGIALHKSMAPIGGIVWLTDFSGSGERENLVE